MNRLRIIAVAAALALPAAAMAQPYYVERITVYEHPRYLAFVERESGALQSGGATLEDILLADSVAEALSREPELDGAAVTVSAHRGQVSLTGLADQEQSERARQIAMHVAGAGNVSGELSSDGG